MPPKHKKTPLTLAPKSEVSAPFTGGDKSRLIFSVAGVERDESAFGGAVKFLIDPADIELHGDRILKEFCADGVRFIPWRFSWDETECYAVFKFQSKD